MNLVAARIRLHRRQLRSRDNIRSKDVMLSHEFIGILLWMQMKIQETSTFPYMGYSCSFFGST